MSERLWYPTRLQMIGYQIGLLLSADHLAFQPRATGTLIRLYETQAVPTEFRIELLNDRFQL